MREERTAEVFNTELMRMGSGAREEEIVARLQVAMACAATAAGVVRMLEVIGGGGGHGYGRATTEDEEDQSWGTPPVGAAP